jgi:hypothetical protein
LGSFAAFPALAQEVDIAAVVDGCRVCHRGELDLSSQSVEALNDSMKAIAAGSAEHIVPIPQFSDEDFLAIAQMLQGTGG